MVTVIQSFFCYYYYYYLRLQSAALSLPVLSLPIMQQHGPRGLTCACVW
jgi:hypothetical protein